MANPNLLLLPADLAAVALIDQHLAAAGVAAERLALAPDAKSLHGFRVAVRSLRALLKANKPWLGDTFPKTYRDSLRHLAHRSNPRRDLDVQIAWLEKIANTASLQPGHRQLLALLIARTSANPQQGKSLAEEFRAIHSKLKLHRQGRPTPPGDGPPYGKALAKQLTKAERRFTQLLNAVLDGDRDQLHEARIAGKRLRYLVAAVADLAEDTRPLLKTLKDRQKTLGKLHDCRVFAAALPTLSEPLVADWRDSGGGAEDSPLPGIQGIAKRLAKREKKLWRRLAVEADRGGQKQITAATRRLSKGLKAMVREDPRHC